MHGNMLFSRDSIFPTPQQSGCLRVCSVRATQKEITRSRDYSRDLVIILLFAWPYVLMCF